MSAKPDQNYYLLLLWVSHSAIVLFLAWINPNHYTTIDSHFYLESAKNLLEGRGYTNFMENRYQWNGTFPIGYSIAIAAVSFVTKIDVLWSSKVVNIVAAGIWISFLNRWFGREKAVILTCILFFGSFLKLWAHSWSEPLFLIILFSWTYQLYVAGKSERFSKKSFLYVLFLGLSMISVRYAGIFIIPLMLIFCANFIRRKNYKKARLTFYVALCWTISFVFYLLLNCYNSGAWFGGPRFGGDIRLSENLELFSKGLLNEFLIRDINSEVFDFISISVILLQLLLVVRIFKRCIQTLKKPSSISMHFGFVAFGFLAFLFTIRVFSQFDAPGYRLLAPFSFLVLAGFCLNLDFKNINQIRPALIILVVLSWLDIIPRHDLKIKLIKLSSAILGNFI